MTEHASPQEPGQGSAGRVVGTSEYGPGAGHEPPHSAGGHHGVSSALAIAQFLLTGLVLAVIASLMYAAGLHSGKGHGEGGPSETSGAAATNVDVHALLEPTPELIAKGKSTFQINCASCHGTEGKGNGPAASALNPKPRDYTSGYWRYGGGVARIVQTITTGSPGTAMAPFPGIPLQDRFALAHYIRTFNPKKEADKPEDLAWLDQFGGPSKGTPSGGASSAATAAAPGDTIPIARAISLLTERPLTYGVHMAVASPDSGEGAELYARRCASCHGVSGEGGVRTRMLGSAPYAYVTTRSLAAQGPLASDPPSFERLVIRGLPGTMMPGNGDLSTGQIRALYEYTQSLRARQESAARARS